MKLINFVNKDLHDRIVYKQANQDARAYENYYVLENGYSLNSFCFCLFQVFKGGTNHEDYCDLEYNGRGNYDEGAHYQKHFEFPEEGLTQEIKQIENDQKSEEVEAKAF